MLAIAALAAGVIGFLAPGRAEEPLDEPFDEPFMETPEAVPDPCPDDAETLAAQMPEDQELENRVRGALTMERFDRLTEIDVAAIGNTVCLRGKAASATDSERAEAIASAVKGVGNVVNRLQIPMA